LRVTDSLVPLQRFVAQHRRIFVLTGAGCSTDSGIPDYRDVHGHWKRPQPITVQAFTADPVARQRYWARSLVGWPQVANAQPNSAHYALRQMQAAGALSCLLTQNVDRLHQRAGTESVIDLHGRIDQVMCMACKQLSARAHWQNTLADANPGWLKYSALAAPDGDADLHHVAFEDFVVPGCAHCDGLIKPDVLWRNGAARAGGSGDECAGAI
jgi:NAD-dependent SIR2 family protein deacetylase